MHSTGQTGHDESNQFTDEGSNASLEHVRALTFIYILHVSPGPWTMECMKRQRHLEFVHVFSYVLMLAEITEREGSWKRLLNDFGRAE